MRKLVTVRKVDAIQPIPGADAIECATVEGWTVVIKKGEFQPGERCVFFEIDAFLPLADPRYAFLAKNKVRWNEKEGIRLRTIKLRGQLSQGLILPLADFPEISARLDGLSDIRLREQDFADLLGIEKWEAPIPAELGGEVEGAFPAFIRKTDQERIQNLPDVLSSRADEVFEVTVKLDGSSMTVFHHEGVSGVCGRNWWLKETPSNSLWQVARQDRLTEALTALGRSLALQGEIVGTGIQGNPEKLQGKAFYLFDIFDIDRGSYLGPVERLAVVDQLRALGATIQLVPILELTTLRRFGGQLAQVLAYAEGPSLNPATSREGVVFKQLDGSFSFKAISNSYLLKHGDR
ncbi:RNA ligase (ATP) [Parachitinimonas caeni]|uniref:RNA ligase (ATP) n=1 Tax=Parachitinimonas caeni TaxID=3031301 RepID=A0ABT7E284_9NEIS|nr:RNA ligase (ATP) [Parachitinimonas caeni]MDK2126420.1 RNA ligase (ATP) [Parachitinimonas caeni]